MRHRPRAPVKIGRRPKKAPTRWCMAAMRPRLQVEIAARRGRCMGGTVLADDGGGEETAAGTTEGEEEAAVTGGGGAAVVGAVPGGGVGTEGATSSVVIVGYWRGRRRVRRWCG